VCRSVSQCAAVCRSVLQRVALPVSFAGSTIGCLRVVGSLKLQVSFAKELHKRDDILQTLQKKRYSAKETYDFKEPTNRATPYMMVCVQKRLCVFECVGVFMCVC